MKEKEASYSIELGNSRFEVILTKLAEQAHGRVLIKNGDTTLLATAVMRKEPKEGGDYFPLMVEYEEKFYAAGKILGSRFVKRETRPSEEAMLVARLIDRTIRPRFDLRLRNDVQVVITVLSMDEKNDPDIAAMLGASLAIALSPIPWSGPIAGVRVGRANGTLITNPTFEERAASDLDIVVAGTETKINMIEGGALEAPEDDVIAAMAHAEAEFRKLIAFQKSIIEKHAPKKMKIAFPELPKELIDVMKKHFAKRLEDAIYEHDKVLRQDKVALLKQEWLKDGAENHTEVFSRVAAEHIFEEEINAIIHRRIIEKGERPDGRKPDELRDLSAEIALLPRVHGSALFVRGQTQALTILTLGAPGDEQIIEGMEVRTKRRFLHHYNFPPFSVGEIKPMRGPGRREIGHGALAQKAVTPLLPPREEFPYTIRLVSEILSSNGSSSMASVCGSSLALMDGGVPIKKHVGGVAMGLVMDETGKNYKILTDIQGPEDHHGDMDFKAAGTKDGITALQMDVKIEGVTMRMIKETFAQTRKAREEILAVMSEAIAEHRPDLSPNAPRIIVLKINPEKIGALIGPGGKIINGIIAETGVQIDIEDDGTVFITSDNKEGMDKALALVKNVTKEIKAGELLEGKVTRVFEFGVMVEVAPRQEGMVHISELAPWRVERVTDIVKIGDVIPVLVKEIDDQGRINLSLKRVPGRYPPEKNPKF
ncbi:MAG: polyribonucleotide nucleotidyltransferase [bacterium]|nr:polyribonucleotide nucleotidyltransferase [bacterium]